MQATLSILIILLGSLTFNLCLAFSYPIFGTTRFQRAPQYQFAPSAQYYNVPDVYSGVDVENSYYYQPRRESNNMFGLPTYEGEYIPTPIYYAHGPSYSYSDDRDSNTHPMDDLHEEMLQEEALDRGEYGPIGQEIWYAPGHSSDSLTKANAAFLHNLMLYQRQFGGPKVETAKNFEVPSDSSATNYDYEYDDRESDMDLYENPLYKNIVSSSSLYNNYKENDELTNDKDVKELKALVSKHRKDHDTLYELNNNMYTNTNDQKAEMDDEYDDWINWDKKRSTAPKKVLLKNKKPTIDTKKLSEKSMIKTITKSTSTTQKPIVISLTKSINGQKEVVLPRPATPVKHPFQQPPFEKISQLKTKVTPELKKELNSQKPHSGAIYDTIKQILKMEQNLDKKPYHVQQKRYVTNEGALVEELNTLKRHVA